MGYLSDTMKYLVFHYPEYPRYMHIHYVFMSIEIFYNIASFKSVAMYSGLSGSQISGCLDYMDLVMTVQLGCFVYCIKAFE